MGAGVCATGLCGQGPIADEASPEDPFCCAPLPAQLNFGCDTRRCGSDVRLPLALAAGGPGSEGDEGEPAGSFAGFVPESPTASYFLREAVERQAAAAAAATRGAAGQPESSCANMPDSAPCAEVRSAVPAASSGGGQGCSSTSTFRRHVFESGAAYSGEWLNGLRHGIGEQEWSDGTCYTGQWQLDQAAGQGIFRHSNGDIYIGQWKGNVAHGLGVYRHQDQSSAYAGEFREDLKDGCGVETWGEWARYEGQFCRGSKQGHGIYIWPDGARYCGAWQGNRMDGAGEFEGRGRHFAGHWRAALMHGVGRSVWEDGRRYEGQYALDQKDGFGIFTWPDGRLYEGFWREGSQHGSGWLRMEDASLAEAKHFAVPAVFANGQRIA